MNAPAPRTLIAAALAAASLLAAAVPASAWTRGSVVTTPRGTYMGSASGHCGYGTCQRNSAWTGPYGGAVNRSGYATRTAPGVVQYGRTTTGPNGGTIYRGGTITRY